MCSVIARRCLRERLCYSRAQLLDRCHGLAVLGVKGNLFKSSWHQHRDIMKQRRSAVRNSHASGICLCQQEKDWVFCSSLTPRWDFNFHPPKEAEYLWFSAILSSHLGCQELLTGKGQRVLSHSLSPLSTIDYSHSFSDQPWEVNWVLQCPQNLFSEWWELIWSILL